MQRYFVSPEQIRHGEAVILGDDAHHLSRVMRARPGEIVIVSDGAGRTVEAELEELQPERVKARIVRAVERRSEPQVDVWLAQSLPKGDKMETVIQKASEIGAARIVPFLSERTVVQYDAKKEAKRTARWRKIAKEAAEQAHRERIPEIDAPMPLRELLALSGEAELKLICYEKENGLQLRTALRKRLAAGEPEARTVLVAIGPEGGFAEREIEAAEAAGFVPIGLGSRILRTETAGLVALACLLYEYGEMGG